VYKSVQGNTFDSFSQMEESKAPVMTTPKRDREQGTVNEEPLLKKGKTEIETYLIHRSQLVELLMLANVAEEEQSRICFRATGWQGGLGTEGPSGLGKWPQVVEVTLRTNHDKPFVINFMEPVRKTQWGIGPANHAYYAVLALIRAMGEPVPSKNKTQPTPSAVKLPDTDSESGSETPPTQ